MSLRKSWSESVVSSTSNGSSRSARRAPPGRPGDPSCELLVVVGAPLPRALPRDRRRPPPPRPISCSLVVVPRPRRRDFLTAAPDGRPAEPGAWRGGDAGEELRGGLADLGLRAELDGLLELGDRLAPGPSRRGDSRGSNGRSGSSGSAPRAGRGARTRASGCPRRRGRPPSRRARRRCRAAASPPWRRAARRRPGDPAAGGGSPARAACSRVRRDEDRIGRPVGRLEELGVEQVVGAALDDRVAAELLGLLERGLRVGRVPGPQERDTAVVLDDRALLARGRVLLPSTEGRAAASSRCCRAASCGTRPRSAGRGCR